MKPIASYRAPQPGTGKPLECAICGKCLVDKRSLRQHVTAAHPVPEDNGRPAGGRLITEMWS